MMRIISNEMYSSQKYLDKILNKYYMDVDDIHIINKILRLNGYIPLRIDSVCDTNATLGNILVYADMQSIEKLIESQVCKNRNFVCIQTLSNVSTSDTQELFLYEVPMKENDNQKKNDLKTNFDVIGEMSLKEMAESTFPFFGCPYGFSEDEQIACQKDCIQCTKDWLNKSYEQ